MGIYSFHFTKGFQIYNLATATNGVRGYYYHVACKQLKKYDAKSPLQTHLLIFKAPSKRTGFFSAHPLFCLSFEDTCFLEPPFQHHFYENTFLFVFSAQKAKFRLIYSWFMLPPFFNSLFFLTYIFFKSFLEGFFLRAIPALFFLFWLFFDFS